MALDPERLWRRQGKSNTCRAKKEKNGSCWRRGLRARAETGRETAVRKLDGIEICATKCVQKTVAEPADCRQGSVQHNELAARRAGGLYSQQETTPKTSPERDRGSAALSMPFWDRSTRKERDVHSVPVCLDIRNQLTATTPALNYLATSLRPTGAAHGWRHTKIRRSGRATKQIMWISMIYRQQILRQASGSLNANICLHSRGNHADIGRS